MPTEKKLEQLYELIDGIETAMMTTRTREGALVSRPMQTQARRAGTDLWFMTSVDSGTGSPEVFFCSPNFGNLWHGGFEIGTGWCFGCDCRNAIEAVYWGLYPATHTATATGSLNSTIDFTDLDYNGQADLIASFPGTGISIFMNNSTWSQLHAVPAEEFAVGVVDN